MNIVVYIPRWESLRLSWIHGFKGCVSATQFIVVYDGCQPSKEHPSDIEIVHFEDQLGIVASLKKLDSRLRQGVTAIVRQGLVLQKHNWEKALAQIQNCDALSIRNSECQLLDDSFLLLTYLGLSKLQRVEQQICSLGYAAALTGILESQHLQTDFVEVDEIHRSTPDLHHCQVAAHILCSWLLSKGMVELQERCHSLPWYQPIRDKISIVIPIWNNLDYTKRCVGSVLKCTRHPYELILVDNASTENISGWVAILRKKFPEVVYIRNSINHGFPQGCNIGMEAATGDHVVLLNNDTIVTPYWLSRLAAAFVHPEVGLVSGMSTNVGSPLQSIQNPAYDSPKTLFAFADRVARRNQGSFVVNSIISGLYLLIRGSLLNKIGGLDPIFSFGNCEDSDYCFRANRAGYYGMILKDSYIDHIGGASFAKQQFGIFDLLHQNLHHAIFKHLPDSERERCWSQESRFVDPAWINRREYDPDWDELPLVMADFLIQKRPLSTPFPIEKSVLVLPHPQTKWESSVQAIIESGYCAILRVEPPSPPYVSDVENRVAQLSEQYQSQITVEKTVVPTKFRASIYALAKYYLRPIRFDSFSFQREIDLVDIEEFQCE